MAETPDPLEEVLLGGPRTYTRRELAGLSGLPLDYGRRLWRAMGFADVGDDERIFTEGDLDALKALRMFEAKGLLDEETTLTSTRAMGQQMARLADWQVNILTDRLAGLAMPDEPDELDRLLAAVAADVLPDLERILVLVWRRQLAAYAPRAVAAALNDADAGELSVGFADLVNYTRVARAVDSDELGQLLEQFESRATLLMAEHGGRLVKTIGDEVMFVADTAHAAATIALALVDSYRADTDLPDLRAGLARGPVLSRLGDVYGEPVNLASRLTSVAFPGTVLIDRQMADALADDAAFELRTIPRQRVRGYRSLEATALRRTTVDDLDDEDDEDDEESV